MFLLLSTEVIASILGVVLWLFGALKDFKGSLNEPPATLLDLESSEVMLLRDIHCPHNVGVTRPWDPACHHNHHVAGLEEPSCFPCGVGEIRACE